MEKENIKQIVRVVNTDIFGKKQLYIALKQIYGVSYSFSNAVCNVLNFPKNKKIGLLSTEELKKIEDVVLNPQNYKIPAYLYNRRKDHNTGKDIHITTSKLKLTKDFDIKNLRKIKTYKGMRHSFGLPVRGQSTKAHFRKGKKVGVTRKGAKSKKK